MKVIYGLGNPGRQYEYTRHNIGFLVADFLSEKWRIPLRSLTGELICGKGNAQKSQVLIAKPQTYMNLSGGPLRRFSLDPGDLIVVHDDMDLPRWDVRVKLGGGTGGHKGLESIIAALGTDSFLRVRCGIGRPDTFMDPSDYVLGLFPVEGIEDLKRQIGTAASAVELCLREGHAKAMNVFNRRRNNPREGEKE
jgi:PTH1 family peptidyl-tRNA hydrolase